VEIEPWFTHQIGRDSYYYRLESRLEFEWAITGRVQTAFYLVWRATAEDDGTAIVKSTDFRGMRNEWKFQISDPTKAPLGFGLYFEYGIQPHEFELEGKILVDKQAGPAIVAVNLVGELELKPGSGGTVTREGKIQVLAGASFKIHERINLGFELREMNVIVGKNLDLAMLSIGPVFSIRGESLWFAMTVLPQVFDFASMSHNMASAEALEIRMMVGVHQLFSLI